MILKDEQKSFAPAPEGVHHGVCVDVADLGNQDTKWGKKHKLRLVWELQELNEAGKPFLAMKKYTASLNEKAVLRQDLKGWRGRDFTPEELKGFDLDKIIGVTAQILITHDTMPDGKIFANVKALMKGKTGLKINPTGKYIRFKDRAENKKDPTAQEDMPDHSQEEPEKTEF